MCRILKLKVIEAPACVTRVMLQRGQLNSSDNTFPMVSLPHMLFLLHRFLYERHEQSKQDLKGLEETVVSISKGSILSFLVNRLTSVAAASGTRRTRVI